LLATIELPADQGGALASLVSGAEREFLEPIEVLARGRDGRLKIVYAIEHFSKITIFIPKASQPPRLEYRPRPDRTEYSVGESFTIRVLVTPGFYEGTEIVKDGANTTRTSYRTLRDQAWDAKVKWRTGAPKDPEFFSVLKSAFLLDEDTSPTRNDPPLTPERAVTEVVAGESALVGQFAAQEFTCQRVGEFQIDVSALPRLHVEETTSVNGGSSSVSVKMASRFPVFPRNDSGGFDRITGRCVAAPTPTPPPTRTPTPVPTTAPPPPPGPAPTAEPTATSTPTSTPEPTATPRPASLGNSVPPGSVLVFILDGVYYRTDGLSVVPAHEPFCSYEHVHGSAITSLLPGPNGALISRSENLGECGSGPPNFFIVVDPR
jgi:hypothetical protein